jgi:hypothetical protein
LPPGPGASGRGLIINYSIENRREIPLASYGILYEQADFKPFFQLAGKHFEARLRRAIILQLNIKDYRFIKALT